MPIPGYREFVAVSHHSNRCLRRTGYDYVIPRYAASDYRRETVAYSSMSRPARLR